MEKLMEKLQRILKKNFQGATVELEKSGSKKITGFLVWSRFKGMEQIKRQNRLWKVLEKELIQDELLRISTILTVTPEEKPVPEGSPRLAV